MPKTLNSARPTPLPSMNGYRSTPASWAASRNADGSRRAIEQHGGNLAAVPVTTASPLGKTSGSGVANGS